LLIALAAIGVFRFGRREGIELQVALMLGFCFFFGLWFLARGRWIHGVWFRVVAWGLFVASLVAEVAATSNPNWSLILFAVIAGLLFAYEFYEAARRSA
jgi:hypothetical protein